MNLLARLNGCTYMVALRLLAAKDTEIKRLRRELVDRIDECHDLRAALTESEGAW